MPESCQDRPTSSYEHIFLLTKSARYYYDQYATREKSVDPESHEGHKPRNPQAIETADPEHSATRNFSAIADGKTYPTRNSRNVWTIPSFAFSEAHFATYPPELVRRCLLAGLPKQGCCPKCGKGWERETETTEGERTGGSCGKLGNAKGEMEYTGFKYPCRVEMKSLGFRPGCSCPEAINPVPSVVLDPFSGSGTTGIVALRMGAEYIGIELSEEYARMSEARIERECGTLFEVTE